MYCTLCMYNTLVSYVYIHIFSHFFYVGGYIGGSMNSTSGLTAIESLVGMAHRSHTLHNNNLSHNGGSHANSNTSSSNTSTSASMNSTSLSSSINTSSLSSGHLYSSHRSPRYNSNLQDILYEETSADIQAMLEEGDYSDHSSRQYQADDGDSSVHSTSSHAPRFLKLSRRYTEGDKALNSHDMSVNPSIQTTAPAPYIAATLFDERPSEQNVAHTMQRDISADENSIFRDIESDEEGEITTRHTFSNITTTTTTTTVTNTYTTSKKVTNTTDVPSTPPSKSVPIPHTYTTAGVENWELESSEPLSYSAPPMALKRVGSRTNNATTSAIDSNAFASPSKKDKNTSLYSMTTNSATAAIENQDELIQYPAKLSRMLDKARAKRTKIENRYCGVCLLTVLNAVCGLRTSAFICSICYIFMFFCTPLFNIIADWWSCWSQGRSYVRLFNICNPSGPLLTTRLLRLRAVWPKPRHPVLTRYVGDVCN